MKPAGETSENTKEKVVACGSHIAAIGHVPHAFPGISAILFHHLRMCNYVTGAPLQSRF